MTTEQISFFLTLAECEHLTYAADKMHISQPALTHSLQRLESELGVPLFDRIGRGIKLNDYGRIFRKHAYEIMQSIENANSEIDRMNSIASNTVNLAWCYKFPVEQKIIDFTTENPDINFNQTHISVDQVDKMLNEGTADFGLLISTPEKWSYFSYVALPVSCWYIAVSAEHPLADSDPAPHLSDFAKDDFVAYSLDANHTKLTNRLCTRAGFDCHIAYQASPKHCLDLVTEKNCVLICPEDDVFMARCHPAYKDKLKFFPMYPEDCDTQVRLLWNNRRILSPACRRFLNYMDAFDEADVVIQDA